MKISHILEIFENFCISMAVTSKINYIAAVRFLNWVKNSCIFVPSSQTRETTATRVLARRNYVEEKRSDAIGISVIIRGKRKSTRIVTRESKIDDCNPLRAHSPFSHPLSQKILWGEKESNRAMLEAAAARRFVFAFASFLNAAAHSKRTHFLLHIPRRDFFSIAAVRCQRRVPPLPLPPPLSSPLETFSETIIFVYTNWSRLWLYYT